MIVVYSTDELKRMIEPIAIKYRLAAVYLFGSYARQEATEDSDVDILIDRTGSSISSLWDMGGFHNDLSECLGKKIDIVTTGSLNQDGTTPWFAETLNRERKKIYERC